MFFCTLVQFSISKHICLQKSEKMVYYIYEIDCIFLAFFFLLFVYVLYPVIFENSA